MLVKTHAVGIMVALSATFAGFVGCGGNVEQATGSTTGTGGVSATSSVTSSDTTTAATSTSSSISSSSSSSGAGGGSPCEQGCAHLAACNLGVTCAALNVNCATITGQYDCILTCLDTVPCASLGVAAFQGCQKQCMGDAGVGPTDAGPGPDASPAAGCGACAAQSCATSGYACYQDATCKGWLTCAQACYSVASPTPACLQACDAQYPGASALNQPIYACTCSSCATQCASTDPCAHGMDGGP